MTTPPGLSAAVIESGRLVLRKARDTECEGIVEVLTDPEVREYLGGPGAAISCVMTCPAITSPSSSRSASASCLRSSSTSPVSSATRPVIRSVSPSRPQVYYCANWDGHIR
jgi:hypothetical protein